MKQITVDSSMKKPSIEALTLQIGRAESPLASFLLVPYPRERGPTTECRPTPHFGLNFLLRSSVYSNMRPCVAALESAAQMHEMAGLYFE